jgi:hypothetical protein
MQQIVISKRFGGFGLSYKAVMRYAEFKGFKLYPWIDDAYKQVYRARATVDNPEVLKHYSKVPLPENDAEKVLNENYFDPNDIPRDDPILVQIVKEMGEESFGMHADLVIVEIPDGVDWEIDEYDGNESIHEKHRSWG